MFFPFNNWKNKTRTKQYHALLKMNYKGTPLWLLAESHLKNKEEKDKCNAIIGDPSVKHILIESAKRGNNIFSKISDCIEYVFENVDKLFDKIKNSIGSQCTEEKSSIYDACKKQYQSKHIVYDMEYDDKGYFGDNIINNVLVCYLMTCPIGLCYPKIGAYAMIGSVGFILSQIILREALKYCRYETKQWISRWLFHETILYRRDLVMANSILTFLKNDSLNKGGNTLCIFGFRHLEGIVHILKNNGVEICSSEPVRF